MLNLTFKIKTRCAKIIIGKNQLYMNLTAVLKAHLAAPFVIVQKT